ncbi:MAG: permease DsdX [Chthoniobacteraceae bacterium]|nr:permease DsdX [Chthoniobacteraceae bacterium]
MFPTIALLGSNQILSLAAFAIIGLIVLIARFKCNAVVALMLATLVVGIPSMPLDSVAKSFQTGVGATLGGLAMIIGLGTILGKLLAESGAAEVIANAMVRLFGEKRIDYAVMVVAFLVGISVFFGVGIVILGPIGFMLARRTGMPILRLMLPLAAGLSTAHGLIPPHPGPMAAIGLIGADTGKTILWSLVIGAPTALITGPFLARWVAPKVPVAIGGLGSEAISRPEAPRAPGFALSVFTMLLPVLLMLLGTAAQIFLPAGSGVRLVASFLAEPVVAMLIAVLVSFWTFGVHCGLTGSQILKFSEQCVAPAASILLLIGAGGGFSRVLTDSGVGKAIADTSSTWPVSPLLLGWLIAGALRIAVGSATVAVTMAAGIMASVLQKCPGTNRELLVLAMGAGSLILSHVNDSGFWFVKEYLGMSVSQTLRTWTVVETGIAVISIIFILGANALI